MSSYWCGTRLSPILCTYSWVTERNVWRSLKFIWFLSAEQDRGGGRGEGTGQLSIPEENKSNRQMKSDRCSLHIRENREFSQLFPQHLPVTDNRRKILSTENFELRDRKNVRENETSFARSLRETETRSFRSSLLQNREAEAGVLRT